MAKSQLNQGIPVIGPLLNKIIGTRNERFVKKYTSRVQAINDLEQEARTLTDAEIREKFPEFRQRIKDGEKPQDLLVEAYAVAREAMDRAVGIRNIFNPHHGFDPSRLGEHARELYEKTKAEMDAKEPAPPEGEFLGCAEPVPGWMQVDIPVELYEAVRELYPESRPPFRARPFDVQLIGGMVLYQGKIAEMKTGEGKTIVAPLACYLAAIEGMKVHVVTVNDYLVQRDRDWTFPFFHALGLTVGAIHPQHMQPEDVKRKMYRCDVVYGTTAEFGFDYLRDNMKRSVQAQVQRVREFAIVDEVDSILIDEARTPLIISGPAHENAPRYDVADRLARHLVEKQKPWQAADDAVQSCLKKIKGLEGDIRNARDRGKVPELQKRLKEARAELPGIERERDRYTQYYELELDKKQCHLTHAGVAEAQRAAQVGSFYVGENMDLPHLLENALRAHVVYQRDRDYVVMPMENPQTGRQEPSVVIVDVFTGRPMVGRQWSDGLHQAVEAKERVPIKQETQTVATITIQNFFKMYKRLAGMTGTADTEAQEFHDIYSLDVVSIPTNKPVRRRDYDDLMFLAAKDKWAAIVEEIKHFHDVGRPVLVGTTSVEKSETLSQMLTRKHGIKHEVLNAKQHEREAQIIENAGQLGAVMIATNMAGRGTDIKLGACTREKLLGHWLKRGVCPRGVTVESDVTELREAVYRKAAPQELGINKRDAEQMPFEELELELLRAWADQYTWLSPKKVRSMTADELRDALDQGGRFLLHRIEWFDTIEQLGGLHVIGTERHESRRIDNQLRGRSGRQGDRGSSRFFVGLEDDLMKLFAGQATMKVLSRLGMKEGDAIEHPMLSKSVERAQRKVEERNFQIRKNILEYDEVMEHQRQSFYGLRQRVLEGKDVRGQIFEFISEAVTDAVAMYLDKGYPGECAAEYARQTLGFSVTPERLRGRELDEMIERIREDAVDDARSMISVTLGEYLPEVEGDADMDFDAAGLSRWAENQFGAQISPEQVRELGVSGRDRIEQMLVEAAKEKIDATDLAGVARFADPNYGVEELCKWAQNKFGIEIDPKEIAQTLEKEGREGQRKVEQMILDQVEELYRKREIEYPVEFAMDMTMMLMRESPAQAAEQLVRWANRRFNLGWTTEGLTKMPPQKAKEELLEASRKFVEEDRLEKAVQEALACENDEALAAYFREMFDMEELPEVVRDAAPDERDEAIRTAVESNLRAELLYFERTVLLEVLDPTWKDHLYAMDQLRDSINFRAFSQKDPRIEYKREGSTQFQTMMENIRDRVSEYIFKVRLTPAAQMAATGRPPPAQPQPAPGQAAAAASAPAAAAGTNGYGASTISGPGIDPAPTPGAVAGSAGGTGGGGQAGGGGRHQRDLDAAMKAGSQGDEKQTTVVKTERRYGRNEQCPKGSGRKYKKCCNRPDGACTGEGLNAE